MLNTEEGPRVPRAAAQGATARNRAALMLTYRGCVLTRACSALKAKGLRRHPPVKAKGELVGRFWLSGSNARPADRVRKVCVPRWRS